MMTRLSRRFLLIFVAALFAASCASSTDSASTDEESETPADSSETQDQADGDTSDGESSDGESPGIRLVSATEGADIQSNPPDNLVVLDVRTPEEFSEGHIEGAVMIDFYEADFADQIGDLDPNVPYLVYCRSGNRSGQTAEIMKELGFTDVADVDGGIVSWADSNLPTVAG